MASCLHLRFLALLASGVLLGDAVAGQTVPCGGREDREYRCRVETSHGVTLLQDVGRVRCIRGYTWDYGDGEVWVEGCCAGVFALASRAPMAWQEEQVPQGEYLISCEAPAGRAVYCEEMPQATAELVRQTGDARCVEEKSWGVDVRGLWVANACAADFLVKQRTETGGDLLSTLSLVECSSVDGKRSFCHADARGGATLRMVLGHAPCKAGVSWDANDGGVWVDHGCRGVFEVAGARETEGRPSMFPRCYLSVGEPLAAEWEAECYALRLGKFASCNARNSCRELTANIRRGCQAKGKLAPEYCEKYRADDE